MFAEGGLPMLTRSNTCGRMALLLGLILCHGGCFALLAADDVDDSDSVSVYDPNACPWSEGDPEPLATLYAVSSTGTASEPAQVRVEVEVDANTAVDLTQIRLSLQVHTGQAAPGEQLGFSLDVEARPRARERSEVALEGAVLGGSLGNSAELVALVPAERCVGGCTLTFLVTGPAPKTIPTPMAVSGEVTVELRDEVTGCPGYPTVVANDAFSY
jgi:hypothetical protein